MLPLFYLVNLYQVPFWPASGLGAIGNAGKNGAGKVFTLEELNEDRSCAPYTWEKLSGQGPNCYPLPREFTLEKRECLERIMLNMK